MKTPIWTTFMNDQKLSLLKQMFLLGQITYLKIVAKIVMAFFRWQVTWKYKLQIIFALYFIGVTVHFFRAWGRTLSSSTTGPTSSPGSEWALPYSLLYYSGTNQTKSMLFKQKINIIFKTLKPRDRGKGEQVIEIIFLKKYAKSYKKIGIHTVHT